MKLKLDKYKGKRLCVAFSGGMDSSALLHCLVSACPEYGYQLLAVHCEHGLRGDASIADMQFARQTCEKLGVPLFVFREDCARLAEQEKISIETAARQFRRGVFSRLLQEGKADYIVTAHHQNDEAETVLFRLSRGAALSGLRAMSEEDGFILRPLLPYSRAQIQRYVEENGIEYCVDESNFQTDVTRNFLRHTVLPSLEKAVPGATENLARFARHAADDDELLYRFSERLLHERTDGILIEFCQEKPLFTRACLTGLKALGLEKDYTSAHLHSVYALQSLEKNAVVVLPKNLCAKKTDEGVLLFEKKQTPILLKPTQQAYSQNGFDGGRYAVKLQSAPPLYEDNTYKVLKIDEGKLPKNAVFRFRKEGDVIKTFGGGTKTLKKFFNEKNIPVEEREWLPLIAEKDTNEVYVVCGVEISDKVKVEEETKKIIYIHLQKK